MRNRLTITLLATIVLLSTTAGLVGHDHGFAVERQGYDCTSDHHDGHASPTSADAELQKSGRRHHHDCVGCHLSGNRSVVATSRGVEIGQLPAQIVLHVGHEAPTVTKLPTGRTLRGPPQA